MPIDSFKHVADNGIQRLTQGCVECSPFVHDTMKPKLRVILDRAIEEGIKRGIRLAHKHTDSPSTEWIEGCVQDAVCLELDEVFDFEA